VLVVRPDGGVGCVAELSERGGEVVGGFLAGALRRVSRG